MEDYTTQIEQMNSVFDKVQNREMFWTTMPKDYENPSVNAGYAISQICGFNKDFRMSPDSTEIMWIARDYTNAYVPVMVFVEALSAKFGTIILDSHSSFDWLAAGFNEKVGSKMYNYTSDSYTE